MQHQIGRRENQRRESHPVAHEEEWVAVDEAQRVVVEVVWYEMEEERYHG